MIIIKWFILCKECGKMQQQQHVDVLHHDFALGHKGTSTAGWT
jgi:hypothetical protein